MKRLLATAVVSALLAGAALAGLRWYAVVLARSWASRLDEMPEDQIEAAIGRIARLGEAGIPALVQALGSDREAVGYWAKEAIQAEIESWKELPADQAAPRWTALADALTTHPRHFTPPGRACAADLASYILRRHGGSQPALPLEVIAACERVLWLEAADREAESLAQRQPPRAVEHTPSAAASAATGASTPDAPAALRGATAGLSSSGGGTVGQANRGTPGATAGLSSSADRPVGQAAPLPPSLASRPAAAPSAKAPSPHGPARPAESDGDSVANKPGQVSGKASPLRPLAFWEALPAAKDVPATAPGWSEAVEVMRRLHAADAEEAADARARLARWGLSPVQREVAQRMFHPDAAVRKELAQALPGIAGLDAAPWLVQLAGDADAEVRLAAITLLLTTSDPALVRRARRLAEADPDPRIRDQAQRAGGNPLREKSPADTPRPSSR